MLISTPALRIGIDFDDVISKTCESLSRAVSEYFGKEISLHTAEKYTLEEVIGVSREDAKEAYAEITGRYSFHKHLPLMAECREVLAKLKKGGHTLFVVSARNTLLLPHSTVWLKYHDILPLISALIHKPIGENREEDYKASMAAALDLDFFIEDAPHYALAIANQGTPIILFDAPYNRNVTFPKKVYRVMGWKEVPGVLARLQKSVAKD